VIRLSHIFHRLLQRPGGQLAGHARARAAISGLRVCGKTGSAEVSDNKEVETNAWFTGFIQDDAHPYAIAVVIEGGGAGARMPSELAARALKAAIQYVG
jgi:cell division protein FtsI/penicillin-binding protein 2